MEDGGLASGRVLARARGIWPGTPKFSIRPSDGEPQGTARAKATPSYPQARYKPCASRLLGRCLRVVFVFPWYSLGIPLVFSWCSPRFLPLLSPGDSQVTTLAPPSLCLTLTALAWLVFKRNRIFSMRRLPLDDRHLRPAIPSARNLQRHGSPPGRPGFLSRGGGGGMRPGSWGGYKAPCSRRAMRCSMGG